MLAYGLFLTLPHLFNSSIRRRRTVCFYVKNAVKNRHFTLKNNAFLLIARKYAACVRDVALVYYEAWGNPSIRVCSSVG